MSPRTIGVLGLLAIAALAFADQTPARRSVYPKQLPEGAGREIAERTCLACHSAPLITQQRKDSTGWAKTLGQMEAWGVATTPAEKDTLFAYLGRHFGVATTNAAAK